MIVALLGGGVLGAVVKSLVDLFVTRRQHSGHIATTEAETLWAERRAISDEQRSDIDALKRQLAATNALREQEHQDVLNLHEKYGALEEAHKQCKKDLANLGDELRKR